MGKKRLIVLVGFVTILLGFQINLQARTFYRQTYHVTSKYSNAYTGNKFIGCTKAKVRFSDDYDFCEIVINNKAYDCRGTIYWDKYMGKNIITFHSDRLEVFLIATNPLFFSSLQNDMPRISGSEELYHRKEGYIFQFHTSIPSESYHLVIRVGKALGI